MGTSQRKIFRKILEGGLNQGNPRLLLTSFAHFLYGAFFEGLNSISWEAKTRASLCLGEPLSPESEDFCLPRGEPSACCQFIKTLAGFLARRLSEKASV